MGIAQSFASRSHEKNGFPWFLREPAIQRHFFPPGCRVWLAKRCEWALRKRMPRWLRRWKVASWRLGSAKAVSDRWGLMLVSHSLFPSLAALPSFLPFVPSFPSIRGPCIPLPPSARTPHQPAPGPSLLSTVQVTGHSFKSNQLPNLGPMYTGCYRTGRPDSILKNRIPVESWQGVHLSSRPRWPRVIHGFRGKRRGSTLLLLSFLLSFSLVTSPLDRLFPFW